MPQMKLNNDNYYSQKANQAYFSVSQVKDFMKCEAMAMAKINGEWSEPPTTPMLIGSYIDSYFEGSLNEFKERTPEIFKKDGNLKSDYIKAESIIQRIENDELFSKCMQGEKQVIMTGELFGAQWKIKMDSYIPHEAIVDLKIVANIRDVSFAYVGRQAVKQSFIEKWKYDLQLAVYQEIVRQNTGEKLPCIIAAADKGEYTDLACVLIPEDQLAFQLTQLKRIMPRIIAVKNYNEESEKCEQCNYCKSTRKLDRLITPDELIITKRMNQKTVC